MYEHKNIKSTECTDNWFPRLHVTPELFSDGVYTIDLCPLPTLVIYSGGVYTMDLCPLPTLVIYSGGVYTMDLSFYLKKRISIR